MKIINLIDADPMVYEACFVAEAKEKEGVYLNEYQVYKIVDTIMKSTLRNTPDTTHYKPYLTIGKDNFRNQIGITWKYKGKRKSDKPFFYDKVRAYLVKSWNAQLVSGVEADDALTIAKRIHEKAGHKCYISSIDKDLDQEEGMHYNPKRQEVYEVTPEKAHENFWMQMILGDVPTDNIPGLSHAAKWGTQAENDSKVKPLKEFEIGKVTAKNLLSSVEPEDYARFVLELYLDAYGITDEDDDNYGYLRYYETFDLVYMLREAPEGVKIDFDYLPIRRDDLGFEEENHSSLEF